MRPIRVSALLAILALAPAGAAAQEAAGTTHWALAAGYGRTVPFVTAAETETNLLFLAPQWSYRLGSVVEGVAEGHLAGYVGDTDGWFFGVLPIGFRFRVPDSAWRPYLALQAGFGWTDLNVIEIDRRFNFILVGGLGARPGGEDGRLSLEIRLVHYSNAGTVLPNYGLNSLALVGGWRLR